MANELKAFSERGDPTTWLIGSHKAEDRPIRTYGHERTLCLSQHTLNDTFGRVDCIRGGATHPRTIRSASVLFASATIVLHDRTRCLGYIVAGLHKIALDPTICNKCSMGS
jgi:hypothetical protein